MISDFGDSEHVTTS